MPPFSVIVVSDIAEYTDGIKLGNSAENWCSLCAIVSVTRCLHLLILPRGLAVQMFKSYTWGLILVIHCPRRLLLNFFADQ